MKKKLEIVLLKANSVNIQGCELYWLFSRNQLEFLFKEVEVFSSPPFVDTVKYQEVMLPLISLENYYGLEQQNLSGTPRYLVLKAVSEQKELVKLIVQTLQSLKMDTLESGQSSLQSIALPKNSDDVLGVYSLGTDKIGVVPDLVKMNKTLRLRGK